MYSAITGEWIKDLDDAENKEIIVGMHFDTVNSKLLVACTTKGSVFFWKSESYVLSHNVVSIEPGFSPLKLINYVFYYSNWFSTIQKLSSRISRDCSSLMKDPMQLWPIRRTSRHFLL